MEVRSIMKEKVVSISQHATVEDAIRLFVSSRVGLLPVVNDGGQVIGVLGLTRVMKLAWPSFMSMVEDFDFVHDFGEMENVEIDEGLKSTRVTELMEPPIKVQGHCKLLRAAAIMRQHRIRDLPIVDEEDQLVGLASWVDVGTAFLRGWIAEG